MWLLLVLQHCKQIHSDSVTASHVSSPPRLACRSRGEVWLARIRWREKRAQDPNAITITTCTVTMSYYALLLLLLLLLRINSNSNSSSNIYH